MSDKPQIGKIEWCDLTVDIAEDVRDFYCDVIGWNYQGVSMGDYEDFSIQLPEDGQSIAGVCHARGPNKNLPAQWLMYVRVEDVNKSAKQCVASGGQVIEGPRSMGKSNFCVIKDPAGAVLALISD
jgi:uncharacterized protein